MLVLNIISVTHSEVKKQWIFKANHRGKSSLIHYSVTFWMASLNSCYWFSFFFSLIVPNGKNVGIWPQTTRNFWSSNYPFYLICEWTRIWILDSERCEDFIQLQKFFSSWKQTFSFFFFYPVLLTYRLKEMKHWTTFFISSLKCLL